MVQAMARGKLVVVTARGGPGMWQEYVDDGRTAFLVPPNDTAAWRARVAFLLEQCRAGALPEMEARVWAHSRSLFSAEALGKRLAAVVGELLSSV